MAKYDDFKAMAIRAVHATFSDGIVFSDESRDSFEKKWEELPEATRKQWRDLSEILFTILDRPLTHVLKTGTTH